jgi:hypothetical protein
MSSDRIFFLIWTRKKNDNTLTKLWRSIIPEIKIPYMSWDTMFNFLYYAASRTSVKTDETWLISIKFISWRKLWDISFWTRKEMMRELQVPEITVYCL